MPVDKFRRMSDAKTKDTGVSLTYINNNYIRSDGSTPVSGSINMNGNTLFNLSNPENLQDAATKKYVDNLIAENVGEGNISGGGSPFFKENDNFKATNTINMAYNKLLNLHKPIEPYDAATKDYVDYYVKKNLDERPHIIAVSTNYCGDLIEGKYQFSFGGSACRETGFLMPHSGRIKKIEVILNGWLYDRKNEELVNDFISKVTNKHFFSIMLFKKDTFVRIGELTSDEITLGKIKCNYTMDKVSLKKQLCFLPIDNDFKNYQLSEGDYINIRSEKTLAIEDTPLDVHGVKMFYLITFLVELDPL